MATTVNLGGTIKVDLDLNKPGKIWGLYREYQDKQDAQQPGFPSYLLIDGDMRAVYINAIILHEDYFTVSYQFAEFA